MGNLCSLGSNSLEKKEEGRFLEREHDDADKVLLPKGGAEHGSDREVKSDDDSCALLSGAVIKSEEGLEVVSSTAAEGVESCTKMTVIEESRIFTAGNDQMSSLELSGRRTSSEDVVMWAESVIQEAEEIVRNGGGGMWANIESGGGGGSEQMEVNDFKEIIETINGGVSVCARDAGNSLVQQSIGDYDKNVGGLAHDNDGSGDTNVGDVVHHKDEDDDAKVGGVTNNIDVTKVRDVAYHKDEDDYAEVGIVDRHNDGDNNSKAEHSFHVDNIVDVTKVENSTEVDNFVDVIKFENSTEIGNIVDVTEVENSSNFDNIVDDIEVQNSIHHIRVSVPPPLKLTPEIQLHIKKQHPPQQQSPLQHIPPPPPPTPSSGSNGNVVNTIISQQKTHHKCRSESDSPELDDAFPRESLDANGEEATREFIESIIEKATSLVSDVDTSHENEDTSPNNRSDEQEEATLVLKNLDVVITFPDMIHNLSSLGPSPTETALASAHLELGLSALSLSSVSSISQADLTENSGTLSPADLCFNENNNNNNTSDTSLDESEERVQRVATDMTARALEDALRILTENGPDSDVIVNKILNNHSAINSTLSLGVINLGHTDVEVDAATNLGHTDAEVDAVTNLGHTDAEVDAAKDLNHAELECGTPTKSKNTELELGTAAESNHTELELRTATESNHTELELGTAAESNHTELELRTATESNHTELELGTTAESNHTETEVGTATESNHTETEVGTATESNQTQTEVGTVTESNHTETEVGTATESNHTETEVGTATESNHTETELGTVTESNHTETEVGTATESNHTELECGTATESNHTELEMGTATESNHTELELGTATESNHTETEVGTATESNHTELKCGTATESNHTELELGTTTESNHTELELGTATEFNHTETEVGTTTDSGHNELRDIQSNFPATLQENKANNSPSTSVFQAAVIDLDRSEFSLQTAPTYGSSGIEITSTTTQNDNIVSNSQESPIQHSPEKHIINATTESQQQRSREHQQETDINDVASAPFATKVPSFLLPLEEPDFHPERGHNPDVNPETDKNSNDNKETRQLNYREARDGHYVKTEMAPRTHFRQAISKQEVKFMREEYSAIKIQAGVRGFLCRVRAKRARCQCRTLMSFNYLI